MFPSRLYADRYFAPTYFPPLGADIPAVDGSVKVRLQPLSVKHRPEALSTKAALGPLSVKVVVPKRKGEIG